MFIEDGKDLAEYLRSIADMVEDLPSERLEVEGSLDMPAVVFGEEFTFGSLSLPIDKNAYWNIRIKIKP